MSQTKQLSSLPLHTSWSTCLRRVDCIIIHHHHQYGDDHVTRDHNEMSISCRAQYVTVNGLTSPEEADPSVDTCGVRIHVLNEGQRRCQVEDRSLIYSASH